MNALVNLNNGTTVTLDGTPEEISDCYIQMLQGVIELNEWIREEFSQDRTDEEDDPILREISQGLPPASASERDDEIDKLLDYINQIKNNQDKGE